MGAPKGNQFWKFRSKHGRDKIFSSPEMLWEEACKYFEYCIENPIEIEEARGTKAVTLNRMRAFTWHGLEYYLGIDSLREYKTNPEYKDYSHVITRIDKIMHEQKFTGAAAGVLNANIIARDLGLRDTQDLNINDSRKRVSDLFPDELKSDQEEDDPPPPTAPDVIIKGSK